jgi:hypothetical protein
LAIPAATLDPLLPLFLAALVIILVNAVLICERISHSFPNSPWEAGIFADAWRFAHGLPVYEAAETGHATHIYGAFTSILIGYLFPLFGESLWLGRILNLAAALGASIACVLMLGKHLSRSLKVISFSILFGLNMRVAMYFTETRPDCLALFCSVLAIGCYYNALKQDRVSWMLIGTLLNLTAFMFKQTYAMYCMVPVLMVLLPAGNVTMRRLISSCMPISGLFLTLLILKVGFPWVYEYMILSPSSHEIPASRVLFVSLELFATLPLFFLILYDFATKSGSEPDRIPVRSCFLALFILGIPGSIIPAAKVGGADNSLLPIFFTIGCFLVWRIERMVALLKDGGRSKVGALFASILLSVALLLQTFATFKSSVYWTFTGHGDPNWREVVHLAGRAQGKVVSPDDPTIALFAKGFIGRSMHLEFDYAATRGHWPERAPEYTRGEWLSASHVIQVRSKFRSLISDEELVRNGFRNVTPPRLQMSAYSIWSRGAAME